MPVSAVSQEGSGTSSSLYRGPCAAVGFGECREFRSYHGQPPIPPTRPALTRRAACADPGHSVFSLPHLPDKPRIITFLVRFEHIYWTRIYLMFFRLLQTKLDSAHNTEVQLMDTQATHMGNQPTAFIYHPTRGYFLHSYRNSPLESYKSMNRMN